MNFGDYRNILKIIKYLNYTFVFPKELKNRKNHAHETKKNRHMRQKKQAPKLDPETEPPQHRTTYYSRDVLWK